MLNLWEVLCVDLTSSPGLLSLDMRMILLPSASDRPSGVPGQCFLILAQLTRGAGCCVWRTSLLCVPGVQVPLICALRPPTAPSTPPPVWRSERPSPSRCPLGVIPPPRFGAIASSPIRLQELGKRKEGSWLPWGLEVLRADRYWGTLGSWPHSPALTRDVGPTVAVPVSPSAH